MTAEGVPGRTAASAPLRMRGLKLQSRGHQRGWQGWRGNPRGGTSSNVCTPALPLPLRARLNCPRDTRAELGRIFCPGQADALFNALSGPRQRRC